MNELTQEIKQKVQRYGIKLVFLSAGQGWCGGTYNDLYVHDGQSPKDVLGLVNKMIDKKGELLLLKKSL